MDNINEIIRDLNQLDIKREWDCFLNLKHSEHKYNIHKLKESVFIESFITLSIPSIPFLLLLWDRPSIEIAQVDTMAHHTLEFSRELLPKMV